MLRLAEAGCALHRLRRVPHARPQRPRPRPRRHRHDPLAAGHPPRQRTAADRRRRRARHDVRGADAGRLRRRHRGPGRPRPAGTAAARRPPVRPTDRADRGLARRPDHRRRRRRPPRTGPRAVAYRVTTPDGVVVVSGDTRVCDKVADLARGADVLVHEACRARRAARPRRAAPRSSTSSSTTPTPSPSAHSPPAPRWATSC